VKLYLFIDLENRYCEPLRYDEPKSFAMYMPFSYCLPYIQTPNGAIDMSFKMSGFYFIYPLLLNNVKETTFLL